MLFHTDPCQNARPGSIRRPQYSDIRRRLYLMTILLRAATGALLGIAATYLIGDALSDFDHIAIIAPMGASAVLAFAVPASPLATPRAIILGNTLSAMIGVGISLLCGLPLALACGLSVCLAIMAMSMTRSLHPPGGATALMATLIHPASHDLMTGLAFPFLPVALNSAILTCVAVLYHRSTGHDYPHRPGPAALTALPMGHFTRDDIHVALQKMPDPLDVDERDLTALITLAEEISATRRKKS